jgi:hypothetical protein
MWQDFLTTLQAQFNNQVVAGAVALGLAGVVLASLRKLPVALWAQLQRALVVQVTLDSRNDLFPAFLLWLNDQPFGQTSRHFSVVQAPPQVAEDDPAQPDAPRLHYSPAPGLHLFWMGGRPMWLKREIAMNLQVVETIQMGMLLASRRRLEALLESVARHASERRAHLLTLYTVDRFGDEWRQAESKPRRRLDSVVLEAGVAQHLHDDIHEFFGRRQWYAQLGIPWRRGYLLYGPPGTGKTSVAYALAGELGLKLCALSLTNPKLNDNVMAALLQRTPPRSLILIEDIDAFFTARDKADDKVEISFSGLLNAIDGVGAQEGRIIVLTTNHRDKLDAALIRPGRIDVQVELGNATGEQLRGLLLRFFPQAQAEADALVAGYAERSLSPAQVQQVLIGASGAAQAVQRLQALPQKA